MLSSSSGSRPASTAHERPGPDLPTRRRSRYALLIPFLVTSACAGARLQTGVMTQDLGHATRHDLDLAVDEILHQAGFRVQTRRETPASIYYETDWMNRKPLYDEAARGAAHCRTRIIVEAYRAR